jgi:hypothetical protein
MPRRPGTYAAVTKERGRDAFALGSWQAGKRHCRQCRGPHLQVRPRHSYSEAHGSNPWVSHYLGVEDVEGSWFTPRLAELSLATAIVPVLGQPRRT